MSIKYPAMLLAAVLIAQPVFADDEMGPENKSCKVIVKACLDAGYTHHGSEEKQFWKDCMKPVIMGKTVSGVTVDKKDVKACRTAKVSELQKELNELK